MIGACFLAAIALLLILRASKSWLIATLCVGGAVALYLWKGALMLPDFPSALLGDPGGSKTELARRQEDLITFLQTHPQSCEGWFLLGGTYEALGQTLQAKAIKNYYTHLQQKCAKYEQAS